MFVDGVTVRRASEFDRGAIVAVCQESLGWQVDDPNEAFFSWKHDANSFGASPMWVAEDEAGEIIGVRTFLRWRFREPDGGVIHAVRAVDTATSPKARGKGVFNRLTLGAIPDLRDDGTDVIFNTPNDKSRPGYLKMGWNDVGKVPVAVRVRGPRSLPRLAGANTPAAMWSHRTDFGEPVSAFADPTVTDAVLSHAGPATRISTDRDGDYLRWRYSFEPLHYRVHPLGDSWDDGAVVFRVRERGTALEVAICDLLGPQPVRSRAGSAYRSILRGTGADYLIEAHTSSSVLRGALTVPNLGPRLTWRTVNRPGTPHLRDLGLSIGDVELF